MREIRGPAASGGDAWLDFGTAVGLTHPWRPLHLGLAWLTAWRVEVHRRQGALRLGWILPI
jgi:hypothetical protein|nr:MAG: hypothetical protein DIU52_11780 [bacterium]